MKNELKSEIAMECSLENFEESISTYHKNMTKGKVILKPHNIEKKAAEKTEKEDPIKAESRSPKKEEKKQEQEKRQEEKQEKKEEEKELPK